MQLSQLTSRRNIALAIVIATLPLAIGAGSHSSQGAPSVTIPAAAASTATPIPTAALPADVPIPPATACASRPLPSGWLARENRQRGTTLRIPFDAQRALTWSKNPKVVLGYPNIASVTCGQRVSVHLSGQAQQVRLAAYRLGWYRGAGARLVWQSAPLAVRPQPIPAKAAGSGLIELGWKASATLTPTASWAPGMYQLVPVAVRGGAPVGPAIPLTIRHPGGNEPLLFMADVMTWHAYNDFGGANLYLGQGKTAAQRYRNRARTVSIRRPLTNAGYAEYEHKNATMISWLESLGLDVAYTTDMAVHAQPSQFVKHSAIIVGGHSEYWTRRMYDGLLAATARGVNMVLLGANNIWWHIRIEGDSHLVLYRELNEDPATTKDLQHTTVLWSQWPLNRYAAALTGLAHGAVNVSGGLMVHQIPDWMGRGTGLKPGSLLPNSVGNEADGYDEQAAHPRQLQVIALGTLSGSNGTKTVSTNYTTTPGGAGIFSAGTTLWACALGQICTMSPTTSATTRHAMRQLTANVVRDFATPRAGTRHPITQPPPQLTSVRKRLPSAARGTYGAGTAKTGDGAQVDPC